MSGEDVVEHILVKYGFTSKTKLIHWAGDIYRLWEEKSWGAKSEVAWLIIQHEAMAKRLKDLEREKE